MNNESDYCMSYRMSEAQRLELQIIRDEERWSTLFDTLMERDLIEPSKETDRLLEDWNNLNTRIEMNRTRLALLKSSSELTEEEKDAILRHMWPLTPVPPSTRAGYAVTFADKMCCVEETKATVRRLAAVPGHILFAQAAERGKF